MKQYGVITPSATQDPNPGLVSVTLEMLCLSIGFPAGVLHGDEIIVSGGRNYEDVTITSATWEQVQYRLPPFNQRG